MTHPIELDRTRNLKYGMRAISLIEKKFGKAVGKIDFAALTMENQSVFIWAGLVHEDPKLTPDKVIDLIDEYSTPRKAIAAVTAALNEAFGAEEDDTAEEADGGEDGEDGGEEKN